MTEKMNRKASAMFHAVKESMDSRPRLFVFPCSRGAEAATPKSAGSRVRMIDLQVKYLVILPLCKNQKVELKTYYSLH